MFKSKRPSSFPRKKQKECQNNFGILSVSYIVEEEEYQNRQPTEEESKEECDMNVDYRRPEAEIYVQREALVKNKFLHSRKIIEGDNEESQ